jgi:hypothetical protein
MKVYKQIIFIITSILSSNNIITIKNSYNIIWFANIVAIGSNKIEIQ